MKKRMDLRIDFAFKALFGTQGNESILMAFLNSALRLPQDNQITHLQLLDPQLNKEHQDDKKAILDIYALLQDNSRVNIEIQLNNKHDMEKRTLYYWARMFTSQMTAGMDYNDLCPTITINIINFRYFSETTNYHSIFHLYEKTNKFLLTNLVEIHFMELPKLLIKWKKGEVNPREDSLVKWLLLLEAADNEEIITVLEEIAMDEDAILQQAINEWDRVSQDPALALAYEARKKAILDEKSALKRAERLGLKYGIEQGIKQGIKQGIEQGIEQGVLKVASALIKKGIDDKTISEVTNLSIEEITKIRNK